MSALPLPLACSNDDLPPRAGLGVAGPGGWADVWQADQISPQYATVRSSGYAVLDAQLPGGGWPVGALIELLQGQAGLSEWRLLLPVLAADPQATPVVMVAPPLLPFGPALGVQGLDPDRLLWVRPSTPAQCLWATEQALRCATVGAVVAWLPQVRAEQLRRLHWAAHTHQKLLFVFRPEKVKDQSSPAPLRLQLLSTSPADATLNPEGLHLQVLKRRGPSLLSTIGLPLQNVRLGQVLKRGRKGRETMDAKHPEVIEQVSPDAASSVMMSAVMARVGASSAAGAVA